MIRDILNKAVKKALVDLYKKEVDDIQIQKTRKDFDGDITLLLFNLLGFSKDSLEKTGEKIGNFLKENVNEVVDFNIVKGFLNLTISNDYWINRFLEIYIQDENYGLSKKTSDSSIYLVEFSSPNTNKPLHLGHIRNNLLGYSVAELLKASGKNVKKVQIINDRGIHICKSMVAWLDYGEGEDPESSGLKGDHLVGKYYVKFDQIYNNQKQELIGNGLSQEDAAKQAPIYLKAQELLLKWERKEKEVIKLWKRMNNWVYAGFNETYKDLGIDFDKNYYESDTYLLGKKIVLTGLKKGVFFQKDDGSIWVDLIKEGFDQKILLRADGTAVYITQDIGTAIQRYKDFDFSHMIYTVGNEQDYHFQILFIILEKLGYKWAKNCFHLSYGMVDLPSGKMKSREGTVVDADFLIKEMVSTSKSISKSLGKTDKMTSNQIEHLNVQIGIGALKYFILKVDPKKPMLFNPNESIDFNGNTGPFIQYTYARIQSILRKYKHKKIQYQNISPNTVSLLSIEKELIKKINEFPSIINEASIKYSPSLLANYLYDIVKQYNSYYQGTSILNNNSITTEGVAFKVGLSMIVAHIIRISAKLLGFSVPNQM